MQQTTPTTSRLRLDRLPMGLHVDRVREDMLERRRARIERLEYIGTDLQRASDVQTRANKAIFEEALSSDDHAAAVPVVVRKCLPTTSGLTGPTFNGSPLYNKRTRLMATIRAIPVVWPPPPMFRGRRVTFDVDITKSPLDVRPNVYPMPNTVEVPVPRRRLASLRTICSTYMVAAVPGEDAAPTWDVAPVEGASVKSTNSSRDDVDTAEIANTADVTDTAEYMVAAEIAATSVTSINIEPILQPKPDDKLPRGRGRSKKERVTNTKVSSGKGILSTADDSQRSVDPPVCWVAL